MAEEHEIVYTFRAEDGISRPMAQAKRSLEEADRQSKQTEKSMKQAEDQARDTSVQLRSTNADQQTAILKSVETLAALHALQSGIGAITNSVRTLGLVDDETAQTLQKVTAGIQLMVGTAEAVKGVVTLFKSLNAVLKTTAIVSTFASIAENPAKGAMVLGMAGLGVGAVAGAMYSMTKNSNTTINVQHESTARQTQTLVDAGAWY